MKMKRLIHRIYPMAQNEQGIFACAYVTNRVRFRCICPDPMQQLKHFQISAIRQN